MLVLMMLLILMVVVVVVAVAAAVGVVVDAKVAQLVRVEMLLLAGITRSREFGVIWGSHVGDGVVEENLKSPATIIWIGGVVYAAVVDMRVGAAIALQMFRGRYCLLPGPVLSI